MKKVEYLHLHISSPSKPTCWMILLFLLFSFSVSNHHNLLIATYDVIIVAISSDLAMFFLFNVIIVMILLGSSKPPAEEFDGLFSFPSSEHRFNDSKEKENDHVKELSLETYGDHDAFSDKGEDGDEENHGYDGYDEDNDDDIDAEDEDSEDDDCRDGDLEMKIEEFIEKMNTRWREEILKEKQRHLWTEPT